MTYITPGMVNGLGLEINIYAAVDYSLPGKGAVSAEIQQAPPSPNIITLYMAPNENLQRNNLHGSA